MGTDVTKARKEISEAVWNISNQTRLIGWHNIEAVASARYCGNFGGFGGLIIAALHGSRNGSETDPEGEKEMAEKKTTFPMLSANSWWRLREKLYSTPSIKITDNFLANLLGMELHSAQVNALNYFKQIGLVDNDGAPTALANKWRNDEEYPKVCETIRQECYPQELRDLYSGPDVDTAAVKRWFITQGVGEAAASKQTSFYLLLNKATVVKAGEGKKPSPNVTRPKAKDKAEATPKTQQFPQGQQQAEAASETFVRQPPDVKPSADMPALHIDIQIHIAPDTPADQIDKIFASMAKHLRGIKGTASE